MISEFTLKPKAQNKKSTYMFIAFMLGALAAVILYMNLEVYRGMVGLVAMMFIIAAIFMYTRYMAAQYFYDVAVLGGEPLFIIRHKLGKRETTMCRVPLAHIVAVEKQDKAARRAHKTEADYTRYFYSPTLDPEITYLIVARSRYEKAEITVEANDEFAETLLRYAEYARTEYASADDGEEDE
jgi:hypothetical protein